MLQTLYFPQGLCEVLGFFILFRAVTFVVTNHVRLPTALQSASPRKKWIYRNILLSFIHSIVAATLSVYSFFDEPVMLTDMIGTWTSLASFLITLSTGYFLHDFLDMLVNDASQSVSLLVHHILVMMAFCIAIFSRLYAGYCMCSLLMEVNSVFLHFRRLMCLCGVSKTSLLYQVNGIMLLMTFVNFRFLTSAWMTNYVIQRRSELLFSHFCFSAVGMAIISALNIQIFVAFWRADFGKRDQTKQRDD